MICTVFIENLPTSGYLLSHNSQYVYDVIYDRTIYYDGDTVNITTVLTVYEIGWHMPLINNTITY
jgi:hypothetical protein